MPTETLVGVNCDQECKWAIAVINASDQAIVEKSKLPVHYPYGEDDPRFTDESYDEAAAIDAELLGINGLKAACDSCDTRACRIEDEIDRTDTMRYGSRIIEIITDLKGE